ncbi:MAG: hypothetical protein E7421_00640 [Ruminococcaceae bacterium]|nr:hypothetical protein [Oscillospiraceae bacterium]
MNSKERGFLLLTSQLGDTGRKPLTVAQFRDLAKRVTQMEKPKASRELTEADLLALGYDRVAALRIIQLLSDEVRLENYLHRGQQWDCCPISRVSDQYPKAVRKRLGLDAPGCLWAKGDVSLLSTQTVALVGSRELREENRAFAEAVGREVARQDFTLVSGNARGADRVAQDACLQEGGKVISIVADELQKYPVTKNLLYLSEDSYDLPFSATRALSRNRVIHTMGYITLIAQCNGAKGGTWDGAVKNLRASWSPVFCFADGSTAALELEQLGATPIDVSNLTDLSALQPNIASLL